MRPRLYHSGMTYWPNKTALDGGLLPVLRKVLVEGSDWFAITSVNVSAGVVTFTLGTEIIRTLCNITVRNASIPELNKSFDLEGEGLNHIVVSNDGVGIPDGVYTGGEFQISPLGWSRPFTDGANVDVYRSGNPLGSQEYLRVADNYTSGYGYGAFLHMFKNMTGHTVASGSDGYPLTTWTPCLLYKAYENSSALRSVPRNWAILGDDCGFYLCSGRLGRNTPTATGMLYYIGDSQRKDGDRKNSFVLTGERSGIQWAQISDLATGSSNVNSYGMYSAGSISAFRRFNYEWYGPIFAFGRSTSLSYDQEVDMYIARTNGRKTVGGSGFLSLSYRSMLTLRDRVLSGYYPPMNWSPTNYNTTDGTAYNFQSLHMRAQNKVTLAETSLHDGESDFARFPGLYDVVAINSTSMNTFALFSPASLPGKRFITFPGGLRSSDNVFEMFAPKVAIDINNWRT